MMTTAARVSAITFVLQLALRAPAAGQATPPPPAPPTLDVTVIVVGTTPLPGLGIPLDRLAAPAQVVSAKAIDASGATDLSALLNQRLASVHVNEMQGNPFQADVNYRGFTASPLLGTPQGVSVYMDGVRLNQPFGDVVGWDLIPRAALSSVALMPGSNPLFGLNTLGGALSLQTKDGVSNAGTRVEATYGRDRRRGVEFEHGGSRPTGLNWYVAGNLFADDGWRVDSNSDVRQFFGKFGRKGEMSDVTASVTVADNSLQGNGLQEQRFLERDRTSVYTKPDITDTRATSVNLSWRRDISAVFSATGNVYGRRITTGTFNGDINEDSLNQSVYQPGAAERAALAAAGYTGVPASGATAANTPFPSWRCIGNILLKDEPGEKCNGLINRAAGVQRSAGSSAQITWLSGASEARHQITVGGGFDWSGIDFQQTTELGYLNPDRSIHGLGVFADGVSAGNVDGEPLDARVDLDGRVRTWSAYGTDTIRLPHRASLTVSGRFNRVSVNNTDRITPGGGPGSLDGRHTFSRFNPAVGFTKSGPHGLNAYVGYSEGSRAPTSVELGCADPDQPCKLPNAMAGDPPLDQVVTRTVESGLRGLARGVRWSVGVFRADNRDDIHFVTSEQSGFGYFTNVDRTRRQGLEVSIDRQVGRISVGSSYTWLDATFQSAETVNGSSNSENDAAESGLLGLEGAIEIAPGNRIPLVPRQVFKAYADIDITKRLSVDLSLSAVSSSFARGNENNAHEPDGTYYLGAGEADGYALINLGANVVLTKRLNLVVQVNNIFDREYVTAAQLGPTGFTATGDFIARPLPAVSGEFPVVHATFFAPGAPRTAWMGVRVRF